MHQELDLTRQPRLAVALAGAALLTLCASGVPAHADEPHPQLSISVDDGSTSARAGDQLGYTITVTNLGARKVEDLRVSQAVPSGASFVSADSDGAHAKGTVGWSVDLAAAAHVSLHSRMALGSTPGSALRLATVACAQVSDKAPPLVCASDSDQLPAGAVVERAQAEVEAPDGWLDGRTPWYVGGGAAVVLAAIGSVLVSRRRKSATDRDQALPAARRSRATDPPV